MEWGLDEYYRRKYRERTRKEIKAEVRAEAKAEAQASTAKKQYEMLCAMRKDGIGDKQIEKYLQEPVASIVVNYEKYFKPSLNF